MSFIKEVVPISRDLVKLEQLFNIFKHVQKGEEFVVGSLYASSYSYDSLVGKVVIFDSLSYKEFDSRVYALVKVKGCESYAFFWFVQLEDLYPLDHQNALNVLRTLYEFY